MSRRRYVNGLSKDFGLLDIEGLNEKKGLVLVLTQQKDDIFLKKSCLLPYSCALSLFFIIFLKMPT